jgi:hypothetical protein
MRGSALVVGGLLLGACASSDDAASSPSPLDAGSDVATDSPTDASVCVLAKPYSSSVPACNACAEQNCCEVVNACYADPDCDDGYVNCALACALLPDDAGDAGIAECLADCGSQYPTGKQEYDAAIGCADTSCVAQCQ